MTKKLLLILLALFVFSCSDDNSTEPANEEFPEFNINFVNIQVPANIQNHADQGNMAAIWAVSIIETFSSISEFGEEYSLAKSVSSIIPGLSKTAATGRDGQFTKTYNIDGITVTLWQEITSDFMMAEVTLNGTQTSTGFTFNNWLQSEILSTFNSFSGYMKVYRLNTTIPTVEVDWAQETSDLLKMTYNIDDGILIKINGEGYYQISTGKITIHFDMQDGTYYDMTVNSDGTGEYTQWGPGSTILYEGTW